MRQPQPSMQPPPQQRKKKHYGWYATYDDFVGHPKWRRVAIRSGVHVAFVHLIVQALFQAAAKAHKNGRKNGYIGDFDFEDCAAATDIPLEQIAAVCRVLHDIGWLHSEYIVDWADRQPMSDDPTAADRQRNRRAKKKAAQAVAMGRATAEDLALLDNDEREKIMRLANLSRVTAQTQQSEPAAYMPITWFEPADDTAPARAIAKEHNERIARAYLFGTGGTDFGPASKIVADNFRRDRFNAHDDLICWSRDLGGDVVELAIIIDRAEQHALNGEAFQNVVRQRIADAIKLRESGPALPFGPAAIKGGRHG